LDFERFKPPEIGNTSIKELMQINEKLNTLNDVKKDVSDIKKNKIPLWTLFVCIGGAVLTIIQILFDVYIVFNHVG
jgi:hypothetical protein